MLVVLQHHVFYSVKQCNVLCISTRMTSVCIKWNREHNSNVGWREIAARDLGPESARCGGGALGRGVGGGARETDEIPNI